MDDTKIEQIMLDIRNIIKLKRRLNKITQSEISVKTGLSLSALGEFERGIRDLSLHNFIKIVSALNISDEIANCLKVAMSK